MSGWLDRKLSRNTESCETDEQRDWLAERIERLTTYLDVQTPSQWAELSRYLPASVTPMPGYFRFAVAPYLREIVDCLGVESRTRQVTVMKGVQLCLTVGVLENAIGYYIEQVKSAPIALFTANDNLAKLRMESYLGPMIQHSGLGSLIKASDTTNKRRTGSTLRKLEFSGGGFLLSMGVQNENALRSFSVPVALCDEVDGWPLVGKDGNTLKIAIDRTSAYTERRKIAIISTPRYKGSSQVEAQFLLGDQRYYFVPCLACGHMQTLRWRRDNPDTGERTGIVWELADDGRLIPDSVRYLCEQCGHAHINDDKTRMLAAEHGAEWRATAVPDSPDNRSYHINSLYSPVGMQSWETLVRKWLDAWDVVQNRVKDVGLFQNFYNNVLGETFEPMGERVRFAAVSPHRRSAYIYGQIPNAWCQEHCGSRVMLLTCAVDVHKDNLAVSVFGWCRDRRAVVVNYWRFHGDTEHPDDAATWGRLRTLIEDTEYIADDGCRYRLAMTLIDSGYRSDDVVQFCSRYQLGVFPIKGVPRPIKSAKFDEFSEIRIKAQGALAYGITVDIYKDRWSAALKRAWSGQGVQPAGFFNAPQDATDDQLRELTREKKVAVKDSAGQHVGYKWTRPSGAANELWDLLVYNSAALDILAFEVWKEIRPTSAAEDDAIDWLSVYECLGPELGAGPFFELPS